MSYDRRNTLNQSYNSRTNLGASLNRANSRLNASGSPGNNLSRSDTNMSGNFNLNYNYNTANYNTGGGSPKKQNAGNGSMVGGVMGRGRGQMNQMNMMDSTPDGVERTR